MKLERPLVHILTRNYRGKNAPKEIYHITGMDIYKDFTHAIPEPYSNKRRDLGVELATEALNINCRDDGFHQFNSFLLKHIKTLKT